MEIADEQPSKDTPPGAKRSSGSETPAAPSVVGIWEFNDTGGSTQAEALQVGMWNRAPGALNENGLDAILTGLPVIFPDYWRFPAGVGFRTRIADLPVLTVYAVARSLDTNIGATRAGRAYICGTGGNTASRGTDLLFLTNSALRSTTYEDVTAPAVTTTQLNVPTASVDKWRIYRQRISGAENRLGNISGDGVKNEVTLALANGHAVAAATQRFSIGDQYVGDTSTGFRKHKDIAAIYLISGQPSPAQEASIPSFIRARLERTSLVELSNAL